jgi:hypothetical protein
MGRSSRTRGVGAGAGVLVAALALLIPSIALAATTVPTIPGAGWIQSPENTANATIAAAPAGGLGTSALKFVTTGTSSKVAVARPFVGPLSGLSGASWKTYATGTSSSLAAEPPSLRFTMYRLGGTSEFTSMIVERTYNGGVTATTWQTTTLGPSTVVWQSTGPGFCDQTTRCTFAEFKAQYPDATLVGLQVAVGSGVPALTSFADDVSVTEGETTESWDFELAAQPTATPKPTPKPTAKPTAHPSRTPTVTTPPTDTPASLATSPSIDSRAFIVLGVAGVVALLMVRPRRSRRNR